MRESELSIEEGKEEREGRSRHSTFATLLPSALFYYLPTYLPHTYIHTQQNDYDDDERSRSPLKQRHNRMAFLLIITKSLTTLGDDFSELGGAYLNFVSFIILFIGHFLTQGK